MRRLILLTAAGIVAAAASAHAVETPVPRAYSAQDCQELNSQIDDSIRFSKGGGGLMPAIQAERDRANRACNSGQYGAGTRQLRDILDQVIAARGDH